MVVYKYFIHHVLFSKVFICICSVYVTNMFIKFMFENLFFSCLFVVLSQLHWNDFKLTKNTISYSMSIQPWAIAGTSCAKSHLHGFPGTFVLPMLLPSNGNSYLFYSPAFEMLFLYYGISCPVEHFNVIWCKAVFACGCKCDIMASQNVKTYD